jgi:hypothetical protein
MRLGIPVISGQGLLAQNEAGHRLFQETSRPSQEVEVGVGELLFTFVCIENRDHSLADADRYEHAVLLETSTPRVDEVPVERHPGQDASEIAAALSHVQKQRGLTEAQLEALEPQGS